MELSPVGLLLVLILCSYSGHAAGEETPKAVLVLDPDQTQFYTGESVTLRCSIKQDSSTWWYNWYRGEQKVHPLDGHWTESNEYTIKSLQVAHSGVYTCIGYDDSKQYQSGIKTLHISERPKAVVTLTPASRDIFRGDSVTLRCDIPEGRNLNWDYSWYFNRNPISPVVTGQQYSISRAGYHHSGDYTCRGTQRGTTQSSEISDVVTLTVSERPKAVVSLSPSWTPVFSGESVILTCSIQGGSSSDWRYRWYRGEQQVHPQTGWSYSVEYRLQSVQEDHSGVYRCQGSRREDGKVSSKSDDVTLTVSKRPKAAVTLTPDSRDIWWTDSVTLRCDIPEGRNTDWDYSWYFNSNPISPVATGQEYNIKSARYHQSGDYTCRGVQRSTTQWSEISDVVKLTVSGRSVTFCHFFYIFDCFITQCLPQYWTSTDLVCFRCFMFHFPPKVTQFCGFLLVSCCCDSDSCQ
ncbi:high affinity immunoglobulin gamma Fc receptor I-like [Alosa pseudoharengus]|uniref:high affinity immunoglobulin gamma Fc receptor I-like n=1 Tax=Alosa pseudoharengus TaxID=34774 RepID=UPI003F896964